MTNSNFNDNVKNMMFATRWVTNLRREKRVRARRVDVVTEQVKKVLQATDQKLILMVRG